MTSIPSPNPVPEYVEDGARVAAILLVWGVIAAFFSLGVGELQLLLLDVIGPYLGGLFALTGLLNAVLYVCYRTVDYWHASD